MIVDAHCHVWEERLMSGELKKVLDGIAAEFKYSDPSMIFDGSSERLIREMNEAGIDKTVILALDYELALRGKVTYRYYNEYVAGLVKEYPDRFIGFGGIDPRRRKEAIRELERCVELGLKGVKLWPITGFYPDDLQFYPFYKRVEELGIPILIHTGSSPAYTYLKYNRPVFVDKIAVDFPEIKIIMAHIGDPWSNEAIAVAAKNPNVFFDISGWEMAFKRAPFALFQTLVTAKITCGGVEKILFGTDWPLFTPILSLKEWVDGIKEMKLPPPMEFLGLPDFTEDEKNLILGGNAARVLDL